MTAPTHQIAVKLDAAAFDALKRLSSATGKPYAAVIADALRVAASSPLVETSAPIVYPLLSDDHRRPWKKEIQALRAAGNSFGGIGKMMFRKYSLVGADGLPLSPSTIRGICAQ